MTESTIGTGVAPRVPTSSHILHDLTTLRQRQGVTMQKIKYFGHSIKQLPVTLAECERRHLDPDADRHVGAFHALQWATRCLVVRTDYSRILTDTLNFNGRRLTNSMIVAMPYRASLYLTRKEYAGREKETYEHFAGLLVAASASSVRTRDDDRRGGAQNRRAGRGTPQSAYP